MHVVYQGVPRKGVISKQISYMTLIEVHSSMQLMHPNEYRVTIMYMHAYYINIVRVYIYIYIIIIIISIAIAINNLFAAI